MLLRMSVKAHSKNVAKKSPIIPLKPIGIDADRLDADAKKGNTTNYKIITGKELKSKVINKVKN